MLDLATIQASLFSVFLSSIAQLPCGERCTEHTFFFGIFSLVVALFYLLLLPPFLGLIVASAQG
jgi:hypothetical protein